MKKRALGDIKGLCWDGCEAQTSPFGSPVNATWTEGP
jgi:hypothetical protein